MNKYFNTQDLINLFNNFQSTKRFGNIDLFICRLKITFNKITDVSVDNVKNIINYHFGDVLGPIVFQIVETDLVQYDDTFIETHLTKINLENQQKISIDIIRNNIEKPLQK